jgi:glucose-1-phosphate cytidylyltransferase
MVESIDPMSDAEIWINGGFFCFNRSIFDVLHPGEELVEQPFARLIAQRKLLAYKYNGFWASMDTFKDKQRFEDLLAKGCAPWQVWKS